ncbi:hypothetical protein C0J52_13002 [Blattella germanica]|nr:hypothetical protein C0J52_13002 [Blattella germanica]
MMLVVHCRRTVEEGLDVELANSRVVVNQINVERDFLCRLPLVFSKFCEKDFGCYANTTSPATLACNSSQHRS